MARRNSAGTYRNNNAASRVSNRILIARWVEAEVLETKQFVVSFAHAAKHITAIGRGQEPPLIPLFLRITFPPDYSISAAARHKAYCRALDREPKLGVEHLRAELMLGCNQLWFAAQPGIRRGDPRTMMVGARAVETMWSLAGPKSGKSSPPTAPEAESEAPRTSPAIIDLFASAFKTLMDLGVEFDGYQVIPLQPEPKAIETAARKDECIETERALSDKKEKQDHDSK